MTQKLPFLLFTAALVSCSHPVDPSLDTSDPSEQTEQELATTPLTVPGVSAGFTVDQTSTHTFVMHAYSNAVIYDLGGSLLLVDSMSPAFLGGNDLADMQTTLAWLKTKKKISSTHIKYLVNTHWHPDHVGNNQALRESDTVIISGRGGHLRVSTPQTIQFFGAALPAWAAAIWPDREVANLEQVTNGKVVLSYAPYSHTTTDLVVILPKEKIAIAGDLVLQGWLAFTDNDNGGTMRGLTLSVQTVLNALGSTYKVVPGHNAVMTRAQAQSWLNAIRAGTSYVAAQIEQGKSLDAIKTAAALPPNQGGAPASVKALDGPLLPLAAFVEFTYRDLNERDERALVAARAVASLDSVSKGSMIAAIKLATLNLDRAAGTEFDTFAFEINELRAIDAQGSQPQILSTAAVDVFEIYDGYVQAARFEGRTYLTADEYSDMLAEMNAI